MDILIFLGIIYMAGKLGFELGIDHVFNQQEKLKKKELGKLPRAINNDRNPEVINLRGKRFRNLN